MKKRIWLLGLLVAGLLSAGGALVACDKNEAVQALELTETHLQLQVGDTDTVTVKTPEDGKDYSFRSTSDAVAVDENGNVEAKKIGSASIIVSCDGWTGVCLVVVSDTKPVDLTGLTLTNAPTELTVGQSVDLQYAKNPVDADNYNSIQWSSSNDYIATVDREGHLTAHKPGEVTVSVTATGTEQTASFTLTVAARPSVLSFNVDDATGIVGKHDLTLAADLFTDYDGASVSAYESSDPSVATVDAEGNVRFLKAGKTTVRCTATCGPDTLTATCKIAVVEKADYTVIRTPEQLQDIGNTSGNYMLGNDVDLAAACAEGGALYHAGTGFAPLFSSKSEAFSGTFDGMGYSIKNLMMKRSDKAFVALFSYINTNEGSEGVICNLGLEGGKIEGGNYVASFISSYSGSGSAAAGLKNCWTDVEIVSCGGSCGGLVAYNGGMIENCYSLSRISGSGTLSSISHNCVNNAALGVKDTYICKDNQPQVTQLVNTEKVGNTVMQAEYKTLAEMQTASLYSSWDAEIWNVAEGCLPSLKTANDR